MQKQPSLPTIRIIQFWIQPRKASKLALNLIFSKIRSCETHLQLLLYIGLLCLWHKTFSNTKERIKAIRQGINAYLLRSIYLSFSFVLSFSFIIFFFFYPCLDFILTFPLSFFPIHLHTNNLFYHSFMRFL